MWFILLPIGILALGMTVSFVSQNKQYNKVSSKPANLNWDYTQTMKRAVAVTSWIDSKLRHLNTQQEIETAKNIVSTYNMKNVNDVIQFNKQLKYILDPLFGVVDIQYSISDTINNGGGDCDDFAWLTMHLLNALGYKAYYCTLYEPLISKSHVTCIYIENNNVYVLDIDTIKQVTSEKDIANYYGKMFNRRYTAIDIRNVNKEKCEVGY